MTSFNFSISEHTEELWQQISSHWTHRERPAGSRFLGSVRLPKKDTERIRNSLGSNLRRLGSNNLTYDFLRERFNKSHQNWLKLLTFAASEYAYYDSSPNERFWQGFCRILKLPHSQKIENEFRHIIDKGIDNLGLVRATGGHKYVSTLWLQSGIPSSNLKHFSLLVQEVSDEYGWWELAHTHSHELSQELLDFCQEKHPQWRTLIHFLKSSCSEKEEDEVEPISGQLVQGIATVAQELERQGISPEKLKDENQREQLLGNYDLPKNFFLRNWDSLIQVLTPKERPKGSSGKIISRRQKPLSLVLDVAGSLYIQLVLPEQSPWKKEWKHLGGTYCQIPEVSWQGELPTSGEFRIPEQVVHVRSVSELWTWQLLNHQGNCLIEWKLEGVTKDLPCLIFDAWSGDRLPLNMANPIIRGTEEIICFTPKEIQFELSNGIEIIDSCVPSSIRGWQGKHFRLNARESAIILTSNNKHPLRLIPWQISINKQPVLTGLKLKGKKSIYLETPTLWYPPINQGTCFKISLESLIRQQTIDIITKKLLPSDRWQAIPLEQWITEPGAYEVRLYNQFHRWSYTFEIQSAYQLFKTSVEKLPATPQYSNIQGRVDKLPIQYKSLDKFWAEEVKIEELWPLEEVTLLLSNKHDKRFSIVRADSSGRLDISLAALYDLLPQSDWYALDYQRLGLEWQRLVETKPISWTWENQAISISGLQLNCQYSLSCWNLLLPQNQSVEIEIIFPEQSEEAITVPLKLPVGIYHFQLLSSQSSPQNLGWWCGSNQYDLPDETQENEALELYCYTILDNESLRDFWEAINHLDYDYDNQWIETVISSLQTNPYYFPKWLNFSSLLDKLQALIEPPPPLISQWYKVEFSFSKLPLYNKTIRRWILRLLSESQKRPLKRGGLKDLILDQVHLEARLENSSYQYSVLLELRTLNDRNLDLLKLSNLRASFNSLEQAGYNYSIQIKKIIYKKDDKEKPIKINNLDKDLPIKQTKKIIKIGRNVE